MATKIPWTDETWNPVVGCTKVSPGCQNCYAERMAFRLGCMHPMSKYREVISYKPMPAHWNGEICCDESALDKPLHWKKPRRIFVCSMGDLFHESVPFEFIDKVMAVISLCPQHDFQILTKRPEVMAEYFSESKPIRGMYLETDTRARIHKEQQRIWLCGDDKLRLRSQWDGRWPLRNLWLGTTCENQEMWNERWRYVSAMPGAIKYVSHEPLLSQIEPVGDMLPDWAIIGCESLGKRAGRFQDGFVEAAIKLASFYKSLYVPVFVKQVSINGKVSHNISEWPEELRVQKFPERCMI